MQTAFFNFVRTVLISSVIFVCLSTISAADTLSDISGAYFKFSGRVAEPPELKAEWLQQLQQIDRNGDGIDVAEIAVAESLERAEFKAARLRDVLIYDLNGDLKITRVELNDYFDAPQNRHLRGRIYAMMQSDKNKNDTLEGEELFAALGEQQMSSFEAISRFQFSRALLAADTNKDGKLTQDEGEKLIDLSYNATAKPAKSKDSGKELSTTADEKCPALQIPHDSLFVVFGIHHSTSLSTVAMTVQQHVTNAGTIFIEDGNQKVTLLLASTETMVWQLRGSVNRVSKVIVSGTTDYRSPDKVRAGVVGVPKDRVEFINGWKCFGNFASEDGIDGEMIRSIIEKMANRAADVFMGTYEMDVVSLPSGHGTESDMSELERDNLLKLADPKFMKLSIGGRLAPIASAEPDDVFAFMNSQLLSNYRTGIVDFKSEEVVSNSNYGRYDYFPDYLGLLQLQAEGKLKRAGKDWKVLTKLKLPLALSGSETDFFVPKGVPVPEGDPGNGCIFVEEKAMTTDGRNHC